MELTVLIMMNKKLHILLVAMLLATGCEKENNIPDNTPAELELNVGIGTMESRVAAIPGTAFARESEINVVLTDYDETTTNYNTSGIYVYKNQGVAGVWLPKNITAPLQLSDKDAMVLAHHPSTLPIGASYDVTSKLFTLAVTASLPFGDLTAGEYNSDNSFWFQFVSGEPKEEVFMAEGEIDYMHGKMTNQTAVTATNKMAQLKMNHALTMVVFNLFKSDQNPSPCVVKSITVKNINSSGALSKGTFGIHDGQFTKTDAMEYHRSMNNFPDKSYFGMMLFPAEITKNQVVVEFLVDNQIYTLPIEPCKWDAGYVNLYRVRFSPARAELVDVVKVVDWGVGTDKEFDIN